MGKIRKRSWDGNAVKTVTTIFSKHIKNKTLPTTPECYKAIRDNATLNGRTIAQLKSWISNQFKKINTTRKTTIRGENF